jgi:hypothetical protein
MYFENILTTGAAQMPPRLHLAMMIVVLGGLGAEVGRWGEVVDGPVNELDCAFVSLWRRGMWKLERARLGGARGEG